jgi:hypothetical protein
VSKRRDYKFEEHEKKHCRVIQWINLDSLTNRRRSLKMLMH